MKAEIEGLDDLMGALTRLASEAVDFRRTERRIGDALRANTRDQYESRGGQSGGWQPLSERYAQRRLVEEGRTPVIERRTDATFRALTEANAPDSILEVQKGSITYGASTPQAALQQRGTGRIPARPLVVVTPRLIGEIEGIERDDAGNFARSIGFTVKR